MNTSIEIVLILLMSSAFLVLMLEAIANRSVRLAAYEGPHIKLLVLGSFFAALFIILIDLSAQTLLSRRPHLFFDDIAILFLIINSIIAVHISHKTKDVFFSLLSSLAISISIIWTDFIVIKMLGAVAWILAMAGLAIKTTVGGKKAEIALKLCYSAMLLFLFFLFAYYFLSINTTILSIKNISISSVPAFDPRFIGVIFLVLAGLSLSGIPPFSYAHIDCAHGSDLSTGFLILTNGMILGASLLLDAKDIISAAGEPYGRALYALGFILVIGLLILWLRALDQSKIRRCVTYIGASLSPLFCLSMLFGTSALLPKLIFLLAMFIFATLSIFALFGSLAYLEPLNLAWPTWEDMAGLGRKNQIQAIYFLIALASAAGLPGTLGYFVKLSLIAPMRESTWFNTMLFISIALGASCTMRFFVFLFSKQQPMLDSPSSNTTPPYSLLAAALILIILGLFPFVK